MDIFLVVVVIVIHMSIVVLALGVGDAAGPPLSHVSDAAVLHASTVGQNRDKHRINSFPIIHCPTSEGVSEVSTAERASEASSAEQANE